MRLLLAAFPPELGPLLERPPQGWRTGLTGIGALRTAVSVARMLASAPVEEVLMLGTCGTYDALKVAVGEFATTDRVIAASVEEARRSAYRPALESTAWPLDPLPGLPVFTVVGTPAVTATPEGARDLGALGALEHLELPGVAEACRQAGVRCRAALAVANQVGPDAEVQWRTHHAEVSSGLIRFLVGQGAFG